MIHISNHQLILGSHPISTHIQRHTSQSGIFCHSITLRPSEKDYYVAHLNISPKEFAIATLNEFSRQLANIFSIIK